MSHPMVFYHNFQPGFYAVVYHHVEQHRGHKSEVCCTSCGREDRPMEAVLPRYHLLAFPESLQYPTHARPRSITLQRDEQAVPVHGVVGLPKFQEYQEERALVYAVKRLGNI